jgi:hypothetical protein
MDDRKANTLGKWGQPCGALIPLSPRMDVLPFAWCNCIVQIYATMNPAKIPLVEGESPLDALLQTLGMNQAQFCNVLGLSPSTPSRWKGVGGKPPTEVTLSLRQWKRLCGLLEAKNLKPGDLPDSFGPYHAESA